MFEHHKEKKAAKAYADASALWEQERNVLVNELNIARSFHGSTISDDLVLKRGEALFCSFTGVSLIEERRGPGHWEGRSSGISMPVGGGFRYRVGHSRGEYVPGDYEDTAIDSGNAYITDKRVIFQGDHQTRECQFAKLIGYQHYGDWATTFSVSNRQKPTTLRYWSNVADTFAFYLALALAHFQNNVGDLVAQIEGELAQVAAARPIPPAATLPSESESESDQ
jgi:hypothetical protein